MGIDWAVVTYIDRIVSGGGWLPQVLRTHGQVRFSQGRRICTSYRTVQHV
jgi:hypothetical protein